MMHDTLRDRLLRNIEALPDERVYQALDYVEFLASKYARSTVRPARPLQRFGEVWEDKMRAQGVGIRAIRGTLDVVGTADRVFSGLADAGRSLLRDVDPPTRSEDAALPASGPIGDPAGPARDSATPAPPSPRSEQ
jgi:hypothetical protein